MRTTLHIISRVFYFVRFARWDAWASQRRLALNLPKKRAQSLTAKSASLYLVSGSFPCELVRFHLLALLRGLRRTRFHFRCSSTSTSRSVYVRFGLNRHYLRSLLDWGAVFHGFRRPGSTFH